MAGVKVLGLADTMARLKALDVGLHAAFLAELRRAADRLARNAAAGFNEKVPLENQGSPETSSQFKPRTRSIGAVYVEQARRKVTGLRPDYGALQMRRGLLPAADMVQGEIAEEVEAIMQATIFEHGLGSGQGLA